MAAGDGLPRGTWFVVLDEDERWRERLGLLFQAAAGPRLAGAAGAAADAERLVRDNGADVLLVDEAAARGSGLGLAGALARRLPSVRVYLTTGRPTRELWEEARRGGLRGLLPKPFDVEALRRRLEEDEELDRRVADSLLQGGGAAAAAGAPPPVAPPEGPRTLAVCSFKGGVGKSLIALNLGLAAASPGARRRRAAALLDADDGLGSAAALLGVPARPTLDDWAEYRGEGAVDPAIAARMVAQTRFGLACVFAPGEADRSADGELVSTVLASLSRMFGLVVVDCAPAVTPAVLAALRAATTVLLVVEPTLDCLDRARRGLAALAAAGLGSDRVRVLCNQSRPGPGDFTPAECREALGLQVLGSLPFDLGAKRACNRCRPLACAAPRGPFMRALGRALEPLLPGIGAGPPRAPWQRP